MITGCICTSTVAVRCQLLGGELMLFFPTRGTCCIITQSAALTGADKYAPLPVAFPRSHAKNICWIRSVCTFPNKPYRECLVSKTLK